MIKENIGPLFTQLEAVEARIKEAKVAMGSFRDAKFAASEARDVLSDRLVTSLLAHIEAQETAVDDAWTIAKPTFTNPNPV